MLAWRRKILRLYIADEMSISTNQTNSCLRMSGERRVPMAALCRR